MKCLENRLSIENCYNMRTPVIILLLSLLFAVSCGEPPMPPTDEEMIRHFNTHEAAFNGIREVISRCPYGIYYPPYNEYEDTVCLKGVSIEDRQTLDSLLKVIGCERIFYHGKELKKEAIRKYGWNGYDTTYTSFTIPYFSHGYSVGGTGKDFEYDPGLKSCIVKQITEHGDLNEIYRRNYNDTTLYKRIKGDWYIQLTHDR